MEVKQQYQWHYRHWRLLYTLAAFLLVVLAIGVYLLVYMTGGIKFVYSHSMYVPILLSGFLFGMTGGVLFGLFAGFVLGPFMPINVVTGEMQETVNWLYRTGFFVLVGFLSGMASSMTRSYVERLKMAASQDLATQLPNRNALLEHIARADRGGSPESLVLADIYIENERELNTSFGGAVVDQVIRQFPARVAKALQRELPVFRINSAEMGVLIDVAGQDREELLDALVDVFRAPFPVYDFSIHIDVRI
ncbi:MAG: hypothetical protein CVU35_08435 [Betaproteobacteria bacterium HGW-Betaproteobacteria-8]|nr:MAG: hypothetical protein CVU35_08435 [Betaproteobacteria bacterium HGW-Betaproteobacteria-8]